MQQLNHPAAIKHTHRCSEHANFTHDCVHVCTHMGMLLMCTSMNACCWFPHKQRDPAADSPAFNRALIVKDTWASFCKNKPVAAGIFTIWFFFGGCKVGKDTGTQNSLLHPWHSATNLERAREKVLFNVNTLTVSPAVLQTSRSCRRPHTNSHNSG